MEMRQVIIFCHDEIHYQTRNFSSVKETGTTVIGRIENLHMDLLKEKCS